MAFMDSLFKRYASPFLFVDNAIKHGQFCDFIKTFREQRDDDLMWEFYLHKLPVWDERTFDEFKNGVEQKEVEKPSDEKLIETVRDSRNILNDFKLGGES